jgi:hypothetical protein
MGSSIHHNANKSRTKRWKQISKKRSSILVSGLRGNEKKIKQSIIEKYGVDHIMKSAYKRKEFKLPSGKVLYLQGYNLLAEGIDEDDITNEPTQFPLQIDYFNSITEKQCRYFPDFYIKNTEKPTEVKSMYTWKKDLQKNMAKFRA